MHVASIVNKNTKFITAYSVFEVNLDYIYGLKMSVESPDFPTWLSKKLTDIRADEAIFGQYIIGILDSDETRDEKNEAIYSLLSEVCETEADMTTVCKEICDIWQSFEDRKLTSANGKIDVDMKLAEHLQPQNMLKSRVKEISEEERKIKESIVSKYSQMTDDEEEEAGSETEELKVKDTGLEKNVNALVVQQAEKARREEARQESHRKKEKDKEDRETQKRNREEKKEKRKTQKGERRR